jgi:hypothetical protein
MLQDDLFIPKKLCQGVTLLEVAGSNTGRDTDYLS